MLSRVAYSFDSFVINDEHLYFIELNLTILKLDPLDPVFFTCRIPGLPDCCYTWTRGGGRTVEGELCGRREDP